MSKIPSRASIIDPSTGLISREWLRWFDDLEQSVSGASSGGLSDGDYGDITVGSSGTTMTIDNGAVTLAKQANMATASLVYRKTAGTGAPEVNTLATLKTDLGLAGTNTGDQTNISGNAETVTTNANLTGPITSTGNATSVAAQTGTGTTFAMQTVPSFATTIGVGAATAAASGAGITFPATQSASTDANTFDDYEEGNWTPTITFGTPGDLSVVYSVQDGTYTKKGREVTVNFNMVTTTFTYTTASGTFRVGGLPFTPALGAGVFNVSSLVWDGLTKAGYGSCAVVAAASNTFCNVYMSGSGVTAANLTITEAASGIQKTMRGTLTYITAT